MEIRESVQPLMKIQNPFLSFNIVLPFCLLVFEKEMIAIIFLVEIFY